MNMLWQLSALAQDEASELGRREPQGWFWYYIENAGIKYGAFLPFLSIVITVAVIVMLRQAKRRAVFVWLLLAALLPLLVGLFATWEGMQTGLRIVAMSSPNPRRSEIDEVIRVAWFTTYVGAFASVPPLLLAVVGLVVKGSGRK